MGFEELADDELVRWLRSWIGEASATAPIEASANVGQITVTVQGELDRVQLTTAAMELRPDQLGEAIERAYVHAYQEALLQVDQILDRISQDVDGNRALVTQIKEIRTNYSDLKALKTILKRRQRNADPESGWEDPTEWDPAADPLRRGI